MRTRTRCFLSFRKRCEFANSRSREQRRLRYGEGRFVVFNPQTVLTPRSMWNVFVPCCPASLGSDRKIEESAHKEQKRLPIFNRISAKSWQISWLTVVFCISIQKKKLSTIEITMWR